MIVTPDNATLEQAADLLRQGKCVGIPTETVYGLAGDGLNPEALARIFEIKQRPHFDPLILHVPSGYDIETLVTDVPEAARKLMAAFWPGALTLVLPKRPDVPDLATSGLPSVGVRCPDHTVAQELLRIFADVLAAPSANRFGRISPTTAHAVREELGDAVPLILDGGPCQRGIESTIIDCTEGRLRLARPGSLEVEEIESVVGPIERTRRDGPPNAPGMLKNHYAPRTTLYLSHSPFEPEMTRLEGYGFILMREGGIPHRSVFELSSRGNLIEAGARLFQLMREADARNLRCLIAFPVPDTGIGAAINDRLKRASSGSVVWRQGEWIME
ncbi:MAG: L-threonylcarbamoyladenylate synthase [Candidatus Methylacidiphilales bacterium]